MKELSGNLGDLADEDVRRIVQQISCRGGSNGMRGARRDMGG